MRKGRKKGEEKNKKEKRDTREGKGIPPFIMLYIQPGIKHDNGNGMWIE